MKPIRSRLHSLMGCQLQAGLTRPQPRAVLLGRPLPWAVLAERLHRGVTGHPVRVSNGGFLLGDGVRGPAYLDSEAFYRLKAP